MMRRRDSGAMRRPPTRETQESHQGTRTAAIYARVSTSKQQSIPEQVRACRQRCDQLGLRVRYILEEPARSAKDLERPQLQRLFDLCRDGRIDVIVVWKLDRLVRSLRDLMNTHNELSQLGVSIHSVTEQFDTSSPFGRFNFRNIASAAELERELIAERARMGKVAQAIKGRWPTQVPPYGYRLTEDRSLEIEAPEREVLLRIFEEAAAGVPYTEIARSLSEASIYTRDGLSFSPRILLKTTTNPIYRGILQLLDVTHERPDLAIMTPKQWARISQRRGQRRHDDKAATRRTRAIEAVFGAYFDQLHADDEATQSRRGGEAQGFEDSVGGNFMAATPPPRKRRAAAAYVRAGVRVEDARMGSEA